MNSKSLLQQNSTPSRLSHAKSTRPDFKPTSWLINWSRFSRLHWPKWK